MEAKDAGLRGTQAPGHLTSGTATTPGGNASAKQPGHGPVKAVPATEFQSGSTMAHFHNNIKDLQAASELGHGSCLEDF